MALIYFVAALVCLMSKEAWSFPGGAGEGACLSMTPGHNATKQTSAAPYKIELNASELEKGKAITVTIKGNNNEKFQGFLVQARDPSGSPIIHGMFAVTGSDNTARTMNCSGNANSMTHTSAADKTSVSFTWTPPANIDVKKGIIFQATVAQKKLVWWEGIKTPKLTTSASGPILPNLASILAACLLLFLLR